MASLPSSSRTPPDPSVAANASPAPSAAPRASISAPHPHTHSPAEHIPPPLQHHTPLHPTSQPQQPPHAAASTNTRSAIAAPATATATAAASPHAVSASDIPPPGATPGTLLYRSRALSSALSDWLWRPFIQGLAFGLGTHLSYYTYQRYWLRQQPSLPFIQHIDTRKNTTAAAAAEAAGGSSSEAGQAGQAGQTAGSEQ